MSMHPTITAALAEQHRYDMIADADAHRIARAARVSRPVPARPQGITPQLIAAARRTVTRLLPVKAPAPAGAGSES
jgi:hypothetical protein